MKAVFFFKDESCDFCRGNMSCRVSGYAGHVGIGRDYQFLLAKFSGLKIEARLIGISARSREV